MLHVKYEPTVEEALLLAAQQLGRNLLEHPI
jgi:hypothetical protein